MRVAPVFLTVAVIFLTLPWLNPFSPGPTPAAMPWLFSLACGAMALPWALSAERSELARGAASSWLAAASISAVLGLLQYFGASAELMPWVNHTSVGEAFGNLRQRNQFATLTNLGLAALMWYTAQLPLESLRLRPVPQRWLMRVLPPTGAVLLVWGNAASSSRTGLFQLLLLIIMTLVWRARSAARGVREDGVKRVLLAAALAYPIAAWALPGMVGLDLQASGILSRLHNGDPGCTSRLTLWSNVLHLIAQKPWLGWGWGELDYAHFITLYPGERFCEILDNAHNLPLHLAVELGLPLALAVCGVSLWLVWRSRPWHEMDATRQLAWAALAIILLHSLLEYPLWYGPFQISACLSICLLWPAARVPTEFNSDFKLAAAVQYASTAIILLAISAYSAWDYERISQIYLPAAMRSPTYRENTLEKLRASWLFQDQVQFAELTTTTLMPENATYVNALAKALLHFSPEPRVIESVIESAALLGRDDEALFYLARYRAAFPQSHAHWAAQNPMH
jgi:O-antigen ligase